MGVRGWTQLCNIRMAIAWTADLGRSCVEEVADDEGDLEDEEEEAAGPNFKAGP